MSTVTSPLPQCRNWTEDENLLTTCYYSNRTPYLEILRISNIPDWYFEKLVFPQQRLTFKSPTEGMIEIYTTESGKVTLVEVLPCNYRQIEP
ncbi:MAG: DUF1830 domain-containing protein [Leptolyngbyaceae cyanobacterium]